MDKLSPSPIAVPERTAAGPPTGRNAIPAMPLGGRAGIKILPILRRYRVSILIICIVGLAGAYLASNLETPLYRARAVLEVQARNPEFLNIKDLDPTSSVISADSLVSTEGKLIQTESLAKRVVASANLTSQASLYRRSRTRVGLERLLKVSEPRLPVSEGTAVDALLHSMSVKADGDSDLITLTVDTPDARLSSDLANLVASEFINQEQEARWTQSVRVSKWLMDQLQDLRSQLQSSENELQQYADKANLLYTGEHESAADDALRQVQQQLSQAEAERADKESELEVVSEATPESLPRVLDDALSKDLASRLADLRRQLAELSTTLTPTHYKVQQVQAEIAQVQTDLTRERQIVLKRITNEYDAAAKRQALLQGNYEKQAHVVSDQAARSVRYNVLKREVETNSAIYASMLEKVKEASVISALRTNPVRVVDPATLGGRYRPNYFMNFAFGGLAALMGSALLVLVLERKNNRFIREPGETSHLQVRELGAIPSFRFDPQVQHLLGGGRGRRDTSSPQSTGISPGSERLDLQGAGPLIWTNRRSLMAEAFHSTAISVNTTYDKHAAPQVIVVTSPQPRDGKSTTAANLAVALAEHRSRVLLVDGDLRRAGLQSFFGLYAEDGLGQLLKDDTPIAKCDLTAMARVIGIPGVRLLPAGSSVGVDPVLLGTDRFRQLVQRLRTEYDVILFDSPPLLHLPDARLICQAADAAVLVSRAGKTTIDQISDAVRILQWDGVQLLGTILNDWNPKETNPTYYDMYYSHYGSE